MWPFLQTFFAKSPLIDVAFPLNEPFITQHTEEPSRNEGKWPLWIEFFNSSFPRDWTKHKWLHYKQYIEYLRATILFRGICPWFYKLDRSTLALKSPEEVRRCKERPICKVPQGSAAFALITTTKSTEGKFELKRVSSNSFSTTFINALSLFMGNFSKFSSTCVLLPATTPKKTSSWKFAGMGKRTTCEVEKGRVVINLAEQKIVVNQPAFVKKAYFGLWVTLPNWFSHKSARKGR